MTTGIALRPVPIVHPEQVEAMRQLRNAGRHGFANDQREIGIDDQQAWWLANRRTMRGWLYLTQDGSTAGYGLLRQSEDGRWWSSVAVAPIFQGLGFGIQIMRHLFQVADGELWAEVLKTNEPSLRMHKPDEWDAPIDQGDRWLLRAKVETRGVSLEGAPYP